MPVASFLPFPSTIEANSAGKKAGLAKIGYFTRPIEGKLPYQYGSGSGELAMNKAVRR